MTAARSSAPLLALLGILAVSLNLRMALASVPPVLPPIQHDLGLSHGAAGLLSTIPVACMGLFAPSSVRLAGRLGVERTILLGVLILTVSTALRGVAGWIGLYLATFGMGIGLAVAGTVLSQFIKARFSRHTVLINGVYTASLGGGAAIAASAVVPLMTGLGDSWQWALAIWAIPAALAFFLWGGLVETSERVERMEQPHLPLPWGSGKAWIITLIFTFQSCIYYAVLTWLPPVYIAEGWSAEHAGLLLSALSVAQIVAAIVVPAISHRLHDHRPALIAAALVTASMLLGIAVAPAAAPWIWSIGVGLGAGALFPLALTLPLDSAATPMEAASLLGLALGVGYTLAALAPFAVGIVRDLSGGFELPFLLTGLLSLAMAIIATRVRPAPRR